MTTITGAGTHTPLLFLVYDTERQTRSSTSDNLDDSLEVQLRPAGSRRGRFEALFPDHGTAVALEDELAAPQLLTLVDADRPLLDMTFVTLGTIRVQLDPRTRRRWIVSWGFREVPA